MGLEAHTARTQGGPCFICSLLAGHPDHPHETVFEDQDHVAFLDRWRTVRGKVLVAPKAHIEHVVRDLDEAAYLRLMRVVREVASAVESVYGPERTCLYSLGSQQGNTHLHWHIAAPPPGVPYEQQQFHALMTENGVPSMPPRRRLTWPRDSVPLLPPGTSIVRRRSPVRADPAGPPTCGTGHSSDLSARMRSTERRPSWLMVGLLSM
ncbi:HIT family protein [Streptomyces sp. NBC_01320]|uniref:HIT family protein n=1 Tax=Streptomyces sp. NBC_01320 TaxID=2903824 RepID=UPI002E138A7F|nr:HIT family protein [Streptomyces sp. NBC_01320]